MVLLWFCYGFAKVYGFGMVLGWFCAGFLMVLRWFCAGFDMVLLWFCYGFAKVYGFAIVLLSQPTASQASRQKRPPSHFQILIVF